MTLHATLLGHASQLDTLDIAEVVRRGLGRLMFHGDEVWAVSREVSGDDLDLLSTAWDLDPDVYAAFLEDEKNGPHGRVELTGANARMIHANAVSLNTCVHCGQQFQPDDWCDLDDDCPDAECAESRRE